MNKQSGYFFLLLVFLFITTSSFSQEITIKGKAKTYEGNEIGLYIYDDFITSRELQIGSAEINNQGEFEIKTSIKQTSLAFLRIENTGGHLYLAPDNTYNIIFPSLDKTKSYPTGNISFLPIQFAQPEKSELNQLIMDFNNLYDNFLEDNYNLILKKAPLPIASFKKQTDSLYAAADNPFFKDFRNYSIASMEQMASKNRLQLYHDYFMEKPILYNNPEYMNFFKQYYLNYLLQFSQLTKNEKILTEDINEKKDFSAVMNRLRADSSITNDTLRELLLINGLYEVYYNDKFTQKSIDAILNFILQSSTVPEHRKIVANIISKTSKVVGKKAPGFQLYDSNNNLVSLDDFKGRYVYIDFWATWCNPCLQEMEIMNKLHQKYGDKIAFVSISIDKKAATQNNFLEKRKYPWVFLHYGNDKQVKEDYGVIGIPAYFLIDQEGNFLQAPAERPSGNIERTFHELTKVAEKKFKVGEK